MSFYLHVAMFLVGLYVLLKGASVFVASSSKIAKHYGVSQFIIGMTLVAFGTSLPELAVSVTASITGSSGIAIGNVVGSNIANIGLVVGLSALLLPIATGKRNMEQGAIVLLLMALTSLLILGGLTRVEGLLLVAFLLIYIRTLLKDRSPVGERITAAKHPLKHLALASLGVIGIIFGSDLLVQSSVVFAEWAGISEVVIGATIIAVGTSLPELVTSATAALRGYKEIAIGNILGSNVFNVAAVLGTAALIRPIAPTVNLIMVDLPFMVGITALLLLFMKSGWEISRKEAAILLAAYIAFIGFQFI